MVVRCARRIPLHAATRHQAQAANLRRWILGQPVAYLRIAHAALSHASEDMDLALEQAKLAGPTWPSRSHRSL